MKNFRKMCRGEKGFTLIELLVVIIILGVLAAVVTLAVTRFIGKGAVESANAEANTVIVAIEATIAEANSGVVGGTLVWNGGLPCPTILGSDGTTYRVYDQMRTHTFKATYTLDTTGAITAATNTGWGQGLTFDAGTQKWSKPAPAP
jgi:prepilin-type N-terminal cleavage/methylation domain-containing protein